MNNTNVLDFQSKREEKNLKIAENLRNNISKNIDEIILDEFFKEFFLIGETISIEDFMDKYPNNEFFLFEDKLKVANRIILTGNFLLLEIFSNLYKFNPYNISYTTLKIGLKKLFIENNIHIQEYFLFLKKLSGQDLRRQDLFEKGLSFFKEDLIDDSKLFGVKKYLKLANESSKYYDLKQISTVKNTNELKQEVNKLLMILRNSSNTNDYRILFVNEMGHPFELYYLKHKPKFGNTNNRKIIFDDMDLFIDEFLDKAGDYRKNLHNNVYFGFILQRKSDSTKTLPPQNLLKKAA